MGKLFGATVRITLLTPKQVVADPGMEVINKAVAALITIEKVAVTVGQPPEAAIVLVIV